MERGLLQDIYLDTDVVVNCVIHGLTLSGPSLRAVSNGVRAGGTFWFSQILLMEYAQAVRSIAIRREVPDDVIQRFQLASWNLPEIRRNWIQYCWTLLQEFLTSLPRAVELPISRQEIELGLDYMGHYALRSQDALHLATALQYDIPVFWTCDDHFERVEDIYVEIIR